MFKVVLVEGNKSLGYTDKILYLKKHHNGAYISCDESEATGIAHNGIAYHIYGKDGSNDYTDGEVMFNKVDGGKQLSTLFNISDGNDELLADILMKLCELEKGE